MAENEDSVVRTSLFGKPDFTYSANKKLLMQPLGSFYTIHF